MIFTKKWWRAALIRAFRTVAQSAAAMLPAAATIDKVDWLTVLGTAALAGLISILTSLGGLPEAGSADDLLSDSPVGEERGDE